MWHQVQDFYSWNIFIFDRIPLEIGINMRFWSAFSSDINFISQLLSKSSGFSGGVL